MAVNRNMELISTKLTHLQYHCPLAAFYYSTQSHFNDIRDKSTLYLLIPNPI